MRNRKNVRRFIADCHNGESYWHNEFDFYFDKLVEESEASIISHIREEPISMIRIKSIV